jgi:hypothetical protein
MGGNQVCFPWAQRIASTWLLGAWFLEWDFHRVGEIIHAGVLGKDALIYYRAAALWLSGGDPWAAAVTDAMRNSYHFYGLPPTVVVLAPFTLLPPGSVRPVGILIEAVAALYVIRRLTLPPWWLLFPPLVEGVLAGNPSIALLALLVTPHAAVNALAPILKVYAGLPLLGEGRRQAVVIGLVLGVATLLLWPGLWSQFLDGIVPRGAQLMRESSGGFSAYQYGLGITALTGVAVLAVAWIDRRAAGWLAPIAVWPASEFHWSTLALPLRSPLLAAALSVSVQGFPALVVVIYSWIRLWRHLHNPRPDPPILPRRASVAEVNRPDMEDAVTGDAS